MSNAVSFNVTLTMTTDWHIGSGVGRQGSVDSLVILDKEDLPYAPSSTVAAMWRDAAEQLAYGLDQKAGNGKTEWTDLVTALFGSQPATDPYMGKAPTPSRLSLEHLRLDKELRKALRGPTRASLRQALTFIKPGVRIDPRRETAMTDMLRFEEVCRRGAVLTGQATIDTNGIGNQQSRTLAAFAFTSLRLLERIGGGRRRGLGCCDAQVSDVSGTTIRNVDKAIEHLHGYFRPPADNDSSEPRPHGSAPAVEPLEPAAQIEVGFGDPKEGSEFIEIPLKITALSPLLIMDQRLGNVTTCLDHVPGTMLLPIVAQALRDAGVHAKEVTQWITSGALSVAPAHATMDGKRGLPMPMRWQWAKKDATDTSKKVRNAPICEAGVDSGNGPGEGSVGSDTDASVGGAGTKTDTTQRLHPKGGEVIASCHHDGGGEAELAGYVTRRTGLLVQTHNTVKDDVQKPTEEVGGLYTYEAIRSGETLKSIVRLPRLKDAGLDETVCKDFRKKISGEARVGAVGRRGYGRVRLEAIDQANDQDMSPADDGLEDCERAVLWLTSDLCLPAPIGIRSVETPGKAPGVNDQIASAIGRTVSPRKISVVRSWMRTRRQESWQRQWGLPRPSLTLVRAGSVVVIEPCDGGGPLTKDQLGRLQCHGAGERRAEGYGQLRVNAPEVTRTAEFHVSSYRLTVGSSNSSDRPREKQRLDPSDSAGISLTDSTFARTVEDTAWKTYLVRRAEEATATRENRENLLGWRRNSPSASQLGKMRGLLNGARTPCDVEAVRDWLETKPEGWNRGGDGKSAGAKLVRVLEDPFDILEGAAVDGGEAASGEKPDGTWHDAPSALTRSLCGIREDDELRRFATAAIVHAALRAHRRAAETSSETGSGVTGSAG